jgi:SH3-like domain-containing protein
MVLAGNVRVSPKVYAVEETGQFTVSTVSGEEGLVLLHQRSMEARSIRRQNQDASVVTAAPFPSGSGEIWQEGETQVCEREMQQATGWIGSTQCDARCGDGGKP